MFFKLVGVSFIFLPAEFRNYLTQGHGRNYPMHPKVETDLQTHKRSLRDVIDARRVDVAVRDKQAGMWRCHNGKCLPVHYVDVCSCRFDVACHVLLCEVSADS